MDQLLNPKSIDELLDDHYDVDDEIKLNNQLIDAKNKRNILSPLRLIIMSATLRVEEFTENKYVFQN
jgi:HrpA-like RNA helicase